MQCPFRVPGDADIRIRPCYKERYGLPEDMNLRRMAEFYVAPMQGVEIFAQPEDSVPSDPAEQILEAGVFAQGIQVGVLLDPVAVSEAGLDGALETLDRALRLILE